MEEKKIGTHRITVDNRERVDVDGVSDVLAFDEQEIVLETSQGMMIISGQDLHVNQLNLNSGKVQLDGSIESINYTEIGEYGKSNSFIGKLFKG